MKKTVEKKKQKFCKAVLCEDANGNIVVAPSGACPRGFMESIAKRTAGGLPIHGSRLATHKIIRVPEE